MVCLHATDPSTIYLSGWARVPGASREDFSRALYDDRTLVKTLAMRRTLFVFPRELLGAAAAGPGVRVADEQRRRTIREVETSGLAEDGARWVDGAMQAVMDALADKRSLTAAELRMCSPLLDATFRAGSGKWAAELPVAPRALTILSASGLVVRGANDGPWYSSRPRWSRMADWLGAALPVTTERDAYASLVGAWLYTFGPGTAADLKWWLGSTVAAVRQALADVQAVSVDLAGTTGYVLPTDVEPVAAAEPWAALLPSLDPTTMGWVERNWYLGEHKNQLFDTTGNAGPTAWWDGRIVGGWHQRASGDVELKLLEDVGGEAVSALEQLAAQLTDWLDGATVLPRFPSPLFKSNRAWPC